MGGYVSPTKRQQDEADLRAVERVDNIWQSTVALMRPRLIRWLSILADNADEATKTLISLEATKMVSFLMRRKKLSGTLRKQILYTYPKFDPDVHYSLERKPKVPVKPTKKSKKEEKKEIDNGGESEAKILEREENERTDNDVYHARHMYHMSVIHDELVDGWIESLELFADGLYTLTGTAIIQKMLDYSKGRTSFAVDNQYADDISSAVWGETTNQEDDTKDELPVE